MIKQWQVLPFFSRRSWASGISTVCRGPTQRLAACISPPGLKTKAWCIMHPRKQIRRSPSIRQHAPKRDIQGQQIRNACPWSNTQTGSLTCSLCYPLLRGKMPPQETPKFTLEGSTWTLLLQVPREGETGKSWESLVPQTLQRFSKLEAGHAKTYCQSLLFHAQHIAESQPATQETPLPTLQSHPPGQKMCQGHQALEGDDTTWEGLWGKGHLQLPRIPGCRSVLQGNSFGYLEKLNPVIENRRQLRQKLR